MSKHISVTETAKIIRGELKKAFGETTFSVRSKSYSGGASVSIYWTDGPTTKMVDAVTGQFSGASFDGMIDLKSYHDSTWNGETVSWGADYVFTRRSVSREWMTEIADMTAEFWGVETPEMNDDGDFDWNADRKPLHTHSHMTIVDYIRQAANHMTKLDNEWRCDKDSWYTWVRDMVERLSNRNWPLPKDTITTIVAEKKSAPTPGTKYIQVGDSAHAEIRLDTLNSGETYIGVINVNLNDLDTLIAHLQTLKD